MDEEFEPSQEYDYSVNLTIEDIHLLHHCVLKRLEKLEYKFENM
jgi:hypothetical protein